MARLARLVVPGLPHHVTQRGNGRQKVFYTDSDYQLYLKLLTEAANLAEVTCMGYCLMPTHLHIILVPKTEDGLRECLAKANRAYAGIINGRRKVTGHFWQGRYGSTAMDDAHLYEALRYVLMSPVKAKLADKPEQWRWSSAQAYLKGKPDGLTQTKAVLRVIGDVRAYLGGKPDEKRLKRLLAAGTIGRPAAEEDFIAELERQTGRTLRPAKRGPKPKKARRKVKT
jgi:putative transposase